MRPLGCWVCGFESRWGMDVWLLCLYVVLTCVGRGLCDGLITRPEESYRVSVCVWSSNPERGGQMSILDCKSLWMNVGSLKTMYENRYFKKCATFKTMKSKIFAIMLSLNKLSVYQRQIMAVRVAERYEATVLSAWTLRSWVRIPFKARMFVLVSLCFVVLCRWRPLRRAEHSSKAVLPSVWIQHKTFSMRRERSLKGLLSHWWMNEWMNEWMKW
jgi:hypothetical protein